VANEQAVAQLVEALTQGLAYDPRARLQGPIFRKGVTTMEEIQPGTELSGRN
jgi:transcriptional accessory protein Tex/SPT6